MLKNVCPCCCCAQRPFSLNPFCCCLYLRFLRRQLGARPGGKKAFEADCNCELKLVALEDGVSLLNRLRMEGKTVKPMWCWGWITTC
ncbi:hypothetical protein ACVXHA_00805 [Escherichia coli]